MNFVTIDVETANPLIGSICQIGLVKYAKGKVVDTFETYVKPVGEFSESNTAVHGITADDVVNAPSIFDIFVKLIQFVGDHVVVSYTNFDERALYQCLVNADLPIPNWQWVDASLMVRQTCSKFSNEGFNLKNVCHAWGYQFEHHNALADAKACGFITSTVLREKSQGITDWLDDEIEPRIPTKQTKIYTKKSKDRPDSIQPRQGYVQGRFFGQCICFTGFFKISRNEIAELASLHGFEVKSAMSKKVHYLVVGIQDSDLLVEGETKSAKHRKAEELISKGHGVQIATEDEFMKLVANQ